MNLCICASATSHRCTKTTVNNDEFPIKSCNNYYYHKIHNGTELFDQWSFFFSNLYIQMIERKRQWITLRWIGKCKMNYIVKTGNAFPVKCIINSGLYSNRETERQNATPNRKIVVRWSVGSQLNQRPATVWYTTIENNWY